MGGKCTTSNKSRSIIRGPDYQDDELIISKKSSKTQTYIIDENQTFPLGDMVKLSLRIKKKIIKSSSSNAQTFPILVSLTVDSLNSSNRAPLDLICVIDQSGSMKGEKLDLVKKTFICLLNFLGDSDRLSIVVFNNQILRLFPLIRTTDSNKKLILQRLTEIKAYGGTDINLGMEHAFHILKQRRESNPLTSIFLLSDGLDDGAQTRIKESLKNYSMPNDFTINTFGFGSDHDPQLMNDIANFRDGSFYFIDQLDTVDEAFVDCLGGLLSVVAQSVIVKVKPEQSEILKGVEIMKAYGDGNMWSKSNKTYSTRIINLISGRQKNFVLELSIPVNKKELLDHQKDVRVASAEIEVVGFKKQKITKKADLHITLLNETEEFKEEEDDREVMKNFYRVKSASLMSEAKNLADQKKNDEAKKILENFKEELISCRFKEDEFMRNLTKDVEKAIINVNPVVYEQVGRHKIIAHSKAQMQERSDLTGAISYQNNIQAKMLQEVRSKKQAERPYEYCCPSIP